MPKLLLRFRKSPLHAPILPASFLGTASLHQGTELSPCLQPQLLPPLGFSLPFKQKCCFLGSWGSLQQASRHQPGLNALPVSCGSCAVHCHHRCSVDHSCSSGVVASRGHVLSAVCFIPDWFWGVAPVLNSKHFDVQGLGQLPSLMLGLLIIIVLL